MPVANLFDDLKTKSESATGNWVANGILNGYELYGAVQTFLNQPLAYLNSTNFI